MRLRIREFRKLRRMTLEDLAVAVEISVPYLSQIERQVDDKHPQTDLLHRIAVELQVPTSWLIADDVPVPVVAKVGAGARIDAIAAYAETEGLYRIACPAIIDPKDVIGVEVVGDSMFPVYSAGDVLIFTREAHGVPVEAIGRRCICVDTDGNGWVKLLKAGSAPERFHLISLNPAADNQFDVALKWAAPVRLHWPAELVEKL